MINEENIIKNLEKNLNSNSDPKLQNVGYVEQNTDGVITVNGLTKAVMGELVEFENGVRGVVLNLDEDYVSIILLGEGSGIREGDKVKATGEILSINASEDLLGRVVNPIGDAIDGKAKILIEAKAIGLDLKNEQYHWLFYS